MKIKHLTLFTSKIKEIESFYTELLGVVAINKNNNSLSLRIGSTILTFRQSVDNCYYHFAINIPSYQIKEAYEWINERTEILPFHGNEIVDFKNWNAEALYFYDPAGNIVEFIARKNLKITAKSAFNAESFQHISEIGLPVENVKQTYVLLKNQCGLSRYSGEYEKFCAIGDETGLFITIDYNQKNWIPNDDKAHPFPFSIAFETPNSSYFMEFEKKEVNVFKER